MTFANPVTMLLLAMAPGVLLVTVAAIPFIRRKMHRTISATALAMGLSLLVLQLLVVGVHGLDILYDFGDSKLILIGLPLATFLIVLGSLFHRNKLSLPGVAACGVIGAIGLWHLGGFVLILTACGISPSGGC